MRWCPIVRRSYLSALIGILRDVVWGVMPFVGLMMLGVVVLCIFPEIATWFADAIMGPK